MHPIPGEDLVSGKKRLSDIKLKPQFAASSDVHRSVYTTFSSVPQQIINLNNMTGRALTVSMCQRSGNLRYNVVSSGTGGGTGAKLAFMSNELNFHNQIE